MDDVWRATWRRFFGLNPKPSRAQVHGTQPLRPGYGKPTRLEREYEARMLNDAARSAAGHAPEPSDAEAREMLEKVVRRDGNVIEFD